MKKICVVTGTRAEYGLLRQLMLAIKNSKELELQILVTGSHLSPEFGLTAVEIESDAFAISKKVEMLLSSDTAIGLTKSMGLALIGFADALHDLKPDIVLLLGDRYEILASAIAASIAKIPIAHLHGGESTQGALDEGFRHSITKLSQLHFVAMDEYANRVRQLGENPDNIYCVGGLGVDAIFQANILSKSEIENALGVSFSHRNFLITFHPATLDMGGAEVQMNALLEALAGYSDANLLFTMPNADNGSRGIMTLIKEFCNQNSNAKVFESMGQLRYLSCLQFVDAVIGNSSSGIMEAPSFGVPTINIGSRQAGRVKSSSIIDCAPLAHDISAAISLALSKNFKDQARNAKNPYGDGGASNKIIQVLERFDLKTSLTKTFYDLKIN
jgi:GDP/UDP-N,N'-diacetylbacillosamine 2-epimerase (hydrolysing)